ncbi:anthranilate synthase component I [Allofrancisella inopinata]|uniref:Anthranilate synthase component 1 n=1 Tax=Allofrancisella inopinata TaxID=1085647 RepID=A0AAE6YJQ4_9GAMM|nr:anthranilate synthase component 1 [Allofrancisella inopinata]QIV96787.1 anthranilate synthase component 1 [Allofrancisella inopinata]TDT69069.1 anthranilate synthase component I [Allofrancisella inopinata]
MSVKEPEKFLASHIYSIDYQEDLNKCFANSCIGKKNNILLESAEINTKDKLKSILVIDSALRISCIVNKVVIKALSKNGEYAIQSIAKNLKNNISHNYTSENQLILNFEKNKSINLDEHQKLKQNSVFDALRLIKDSFKITNEYSVFLAGLFAYDLVGNFEDIGKVERKNKCPDYVFYLAETILVSDHQQKKTFIQINSFDEKIQSQLDKSLEEIKKSLNHDFQTQITKIKDLEPQISINDREFCNVVDKLKTHIVNGDIFQVVPSRSFYLPCQNSLEVYRELKRTNPSPYMFYMQDEDFILFGASPESALKYETKTNQVEIYPIAGTRPRGKNADGSINHDLDNRIELELRLDTKENAEHMMLVDLARNDIARISKTGTRFLADLLKVDRYSHVMHLVSRVVGQLADDLDALHAYQACMNMGTLTGAPKIKAMQLISEVEQQTRGSYGGAVGYINGYGDLDSCIVIRSAYVENGVAEIQAGAGVVLDSIPIAEADETRTKAQAVISAIKNVHGEAHG